MFWLSKLNWFFRIVFIFPNKLFGLYWSNHAHYGLFIPPSQDIWHHVLCILSAQVKPDLILSLAIFQCFTFFWRLRSDMLYILFILVFGSKSPWPCTTAFSPSRLLWNPPFRKCATYTLFPSHPLSHLWIGELIIKDGEFSKRWSWVSPSSYRFFSRALSFSLI